jgi:thiamine-phosphate pyrophosphorylase
VKTAACHPSCFTEGAKIKSNSSFRALFGDSNLYLITDRKLFKAHCSMYLEIETVLEAGVKVIQLREKDLPAMELLDMARWMRDLTTEYHAHLFINDRVDIALAVEADGVQLGRQSMPVSTVRKIAGDRLCIGVSTHSIDEALDAEKDGADFITLGPVYKTPSKLKFGNPIGRGVLKEAKSRVSIPVLAIGGIKQDKVKEVMNTGADGIALISAILTSENIKETTEEFLRLLK